MGKKDKYRQQKIKNKSHGGKSSNRPSSGLDHFVDTSKTAVVVFNKEFNDNIPMYYLDSGVVIAFSLIKLLEDIGFNDAQIKTTLIRGSSDTVNGGEVIEGNPHNIDMRTAEILFDLYQKNKSGDVAFCIPPAVYKETMLDGITHDNTKRQYTRKFIRESCFLVFPKEDISSFARKTVELQNKLKSVKSKNGEFGLCPDFQKKKKGGVRILVDVNFEDRLILSQIAVIVKQGKTKAEIISLSNTDEELNNERVVDLYNESKRVEEESISSIKPNSGNGQTGKFLQINSKDMGKRSAVSGKKNPVAAGKNDVSEQIAEILEEYFNGDGGLQVQTPDELEK